MTSPDPTTPAGWAAAWGTSAVAKPAARTVDAHAHLMVAEAAELARPHFRPEADPRAFFSSAESTALNQQFYQVVHDKFADPEARLADMDAMGVDVQLVAISPLQYFYWADAQLSPRLAMVQNDHIAELAAARPDRLMGIGTLPMAHPEAAVSEARRLAGDLGFRGVQIGADVNGVDLDDEMLTPVWSALEDLGLVAVLHPAGFTHAQRLTDYYLVNVIGMPLSSTLTVTRMILGGVFERHPGLRMLVVHGGGYLAFYPARTDHAFRHRPEMRRHIDRLPSEYLAQLYFDTTVFDPRLVERLVETFGADHVLLGTDYPFDMGSTDPLALVAATELDDADRHRIMGGNAAGLFGI